MFNNFFNRRADTLLENKIHQHEVTIQELQADRELASKDKEKRFTVKAIGFARNYISQIALANGRYGFERPTSSLEEIKIATESDSYLKRTISKYTNLMFKEGFELKGEDALVDYIQARFRLMDFGTKKPMNILFEEIGQDLFKYSNAYLVKQRQPLDGLPIKAKGLWGKDAIAGYFRVDPASMTVKRNAQGTVLKYRQEFGFKNKDFPVEDIIHFYIDRDAGTAFGTPRIGPALEDIKILRRIEGNVLSLIYRYCIPIFQWKIGVAQAGLGATVTEIKDAKKEVENSQLDGIIITNERTDIKAIGAEGTALDCTGYLDYHEKRVFRALNTPDPLDENDKMNDDVHVEVKHYQKRMSTIIESEILRELLMEGGYNPILKEEDIVSFSFNEVNIDTKVKVENHEMLKWQSNMTTLEEARQAVGKKQSNIKDNDLYAHRIDVKKQEQVIAKQTQDQIKLEKEKSKLTSNEVNVSSVTAKNNGNGQTKTTKSSSAKKDLISRNRPVNQYGTTSVKVRESIGGHNKETTKIIYPLLFEIYNAYNGDNKAENIKEFMKAMEDYINYTAEDGFIKGISDSGIRNREKLLISKSILNIARYEIEMNYEKLLNEIDELENTKDIGIRLETYENKLHYLITFNLAKIYHIGYIECIKHYNVDKDEVYIHYASDKVETLRDSISTINVDSYIWEEIPPYHIGDLTYLDLNEFGGEQ